MKYYCENCKKMTPLSNKIENGPTTAYTIDLGGPITKTYVGSKSYNISMCAVCGKESRFFSSKEAYEKQKAKDDSFDNWIILKIFVIWPIFIIFSNVWFYSSEYNWFQNILAGTLLGGFLIFCYELIVNGLFRGRY